MMGVSPLQFGGSFIIKDKDQRTDAIRVTQAILKDAVDTSDPAQFEVIDRSIKKFQPFGLYKDPGNYVDPRASKGYYVIHVPDEADKPMIFNFQNLGIEFEKIKQKAKVSLHEMFNLPAGNANAPKRGKQKEKELDMVA